MVIALTEDKNNKKIEKIFLDNNKEIKYKLVCKINQNEKIINIINPKFFDKIKSKCKIIKNNKLDNLKDEFIKVDKVGKLTVVLIFYFGISNIHEIIGGFKSFDKISEINNKNRNKYNNYLKYSFHDMYKIIYKNQPINGSVRSNFWRKFCGKI